MKPKHVLMPIALIALFGCEKSDESAKVEKTATETKSAVESMTEAIDVIKEKTEEAARTAQDKAEQALEQAEYYRPTQ